MRGVRLKIFGRVQGVLFRHSAKHEAEKLGLSGWIRNAPDSSVELVAQGREEALQKFIDWCHRGPLLAKVEKVEIMPLENVEEAEEFRIIS